MGHKWMGKYNQTVSHCCWFYLALLFIPCIIPQILRSLFKLFNTNAGIGVYWCGMNVRFRQAVLVHFTFMECLHWINCLWHSGVICPLSPTLCLFMEKLRLPYEIDETYPFLRYHIQLLRYVETQRLLKLHQQLSPWIISVFHIICKRIYIVLCTNCTTFQTIFAFMWAYFGL